jgi:LacI family transcriptional regulator, galactose operon repressor
VDNDVQICELSIPPLSSIVQGGSELGYQAACLLDRMMHGDSHPGTTSRVQPVMVVTRQSTDILSIDDTEVTLAIRFIREQACKGIQVRDVVNQVSISRVSLEKRFKQILGRTMHREIKRVQLEEVKRLLRTTDLPIHQIALRTGFEYAEYLSKLFHGTMGQTLGQYRIAMRE